MRQDEEIAVALLERLRALPELTVDSVERALGIRLSPKKDTNPFFVFHGGKLDSRFHRVELKVPGKGATTRERTLILEGSADVAHAVIVDLLGPAEPYQVAPQFVTYGYGEGAEPTLFVQFDPTLRRLTKIVLRRTQ